MNLLKIVVLAQLMLIFVVLSLFTASLKQVSLSTQLAAQTPVQGQPGAVGPIGPIGTTGLSGLPGIPGAPGPTGNTGQTGAIGPTGTAGIPGPKGDPGPQGQVGPVGPQGTPGTSTELRIDPITHNLECRLVGDTLWTVLINPGDTCP